MRESIISKLENETVQEYIGRMCEDVKLNLGLTWEELTDILNEELDEDLSSRTYRRKYNSWLKSQVVSELPESELSEEVVDELLAIKKERIKLRDELSQINNQVRLQAREEAMMEMAIEAAKEVAKVKLLDVPIPNMKAGNAEKQGILAIGDWHYGLDVDVFYNLYNPEICRRRVRLLAMKCANLIEKENIEILNVVNLGDMISGRIHLPLRVNSRLDAVSQTMEVSELLAEFLTELSHHANINYFSVLDNHARIEPNKKESLQTESFARIIDWYLEERLCNNTHIKFHRNEFGDDLCTFEMFGYKIAAVHGDKDKTNRLITNLNLYTQNHLDLILSAHLHHFSADESNETLRLCNGSLMGCDDYSSDLRLNSKPSQLFIVSTPLNIVDSIHKLDLK